MAKLLKPYSRKTEVGVEVTIKRNTPRGKGRILSFNRAVVEIALSESDAHAIGWHLDPKSHIRKDEP